MSERAQAVAASRRPRKSTRRVVVHKVVAPAAEEAAFAREWGEQRSEMREDELRRASLPALLMHGLAFEEGTPVMSILRAARERVDLWSAAGGPDPVEIPCSALDGLRRLLEVAIELDRRATIRGATR